MSITDVQRGQKFVRWTVVRSASRDDRGRTRTVVRCICGTEAIVLDDALKRGNTNGCRSVTCRKQHEALHGPPPKKETR